MSQRIAILGTGDAATPFDRVPAPISASAGEDFVPVLVNVPDAVFPDTPAARIESEQAYISAGQAAAREDFAALYINTVGDYGLQVLRDSVSIPVVGSGETSLRLAQSSGSSFAIVTIWPPSLRFIYDQILDASGTSGYCCAIHFLSEDTDLDTLENDDNFVNDMKSCRASSMRDLRAACRSAMDEQGAEVIVLGCTCMQPVADMLASEGFPVVEPMVAGYKFTELLLGI